MDLTESLERAIKLFHKRTAVLCGDTVYTYREFYERVNRLSSGLQSLGVQKGDRVAFMMLNCHRHLETYYAITNIGGVVVPLNIRLSPQELTYIINDSESKVLVTDETLLPLAEAIRPKIETVEHLILAGDSKGPDHMMDYEKFVAQSAPTPPGVKIDDDDLAGIFYTGGTTGKPKGVMLSHDNLMSNCINLQGGLGFKKGDIYLHAAPMFHLANGAAMIAATHAGVAHAFIKAFAPDLTLQAIERHKVTVTLLIPAMINFVVNHPDLDKHDISSLRLVVYGGSPIPVEVLRKAMQKLPNCHFIQAYGMTEASPVLTVLNQDDHTPQGPPEVLARLASGGQPIHGVRVRVVNAEGQDVKPGEIGEVIAKGPTITKGYWKLPQETTEAIRDGWYYSGDLATVDDEMYVFIVDRRKDMIVSGGENIYSTEVENALYTHPAVLEVAVIGVPDDKWGEAVKAVVVVRPGHSVTAEELIAHCKENLASYKAPKSVDFVEALPKSGAGKILKRELREQYWKGQDRRVH